MPRLLVRAGVLTLLGREPLGAQGAGRPGGTALLDRLEHPFRPAAVDQGVRARAAEQGVQVRQSVGVLRHQPDPLAVDGAQPGSVLP